ncbi:hypothetical protein HYT24_02060 [Candidatus Pacearchaeota archaeon]|nr:hypothetical protein [Candidatus Pacearchaeota archaeon]
MENEKILSVKDLCDLAKRGEIHVGDHIKVKGGYRVGMEEPNPDIVTSEIVYDVVLSPVPRVDTMVVQMGTVSFSTFIPETRYMVEPEYTVRLPGALRGKIQHHNLLEAEL